MGEKLSFGENGLFQGNGKNTASLVRERWTVEA
jgi:hypothetical protein